MTTEPREPNRETRLRMSPLELRLYMAALLAVVYAISWRATGVHAPATEPTITSTPTNSEPPRFVWIDSLAPETRPAIVLPAGWQLASKERPSSTQPARVHSLPSRRAPRVRTRSS